MEVIDGFLRKSLHYTLFVSVTMGSARESFLTNLALFFASFWVFVFYFLHSLFRYFNPIRFRFIKIFHSQMKNYCCADILLQGSNELDSKSVVPGSLPEYPSSQIFPMKEIYKRKTGGQQTSESNFVFKFKFPSYEEFIRSHQRSCDSGSLDDAPATNNSENEFLHPNKFAHLNEESEVTSCSRKYEFQGAKNNCSFMQDAKAENFAVKVIFSDVNEGSLQVNEVINSGLSSKSDYLKGISDAEAFSGEVPLSSGEEEQLLIEKVSHSKKVQLDYHKSDFLEEADLCGENNFLVSSSDSESFISSNEFSTISSFTGSISDDFLSDTDFEEANERGTLVKNGGNLKHMDLKDCDLQNLNFGHEPDDFDEEDEDILENFQKLEGSVKGCENDSLSKKTLNDEEEIGTKHEKQMDCPENSGETHKQNSSSATDNEDSNRLETLWEHQDLIEQLKMELKKVKATGLPTILEESTESPKIMEDLKPWKIDEKLQHEDRLGELHKFYKSYRERMRKFDILNYQKMYAIGVLQSKDPFQSFSSTPKSSSPAIKSKLKLLCKRKNLNLDPAVNFIREMHSDLEMVYVGQLCLSWEFLQWQYEKAFDLWEADPYGLCQYNEVAGEFQHFQVLLQRFIENEPFQGPRVENYVKNRCFMRNLLQVPVIREDSANERKRTRKRGRDSGVITSDMLLEILEESIRNIWRFIRADKYAHNLILKGKKEIETELQDPTDLRLLMEIQTDVQKKEKKLRDLQRSGNCILKRFQRHEEEGTDHLYFFSQVDMKLVTRVLNMSKITSEQLIWCHNKLDKITFVNRMIHVQPSFLLFPC